jgi:hypothetical protein
MFDPYAHMPRLRESQRKYREIAASIKNEIAKLGRA